MFNQILAKNNCFIILLLKSFHFYGILYRPAEKKIS